MNNVKGAKSRDDRQMFILARNGFEGLQEQFFELNVLHALRNNLRMAVEIAQQDNLCVN
jgi:hypothetical protein